MSDEKNEKDLTQGLEDYLGNPTPQPTQEPCVGEECFIITDKSLVERINKKIITEDGRQLL